MYEHIARLATANPREAMRIARDQLGDFDGSPYGKLACIFAACIGYARLLERSAEERDWLKNLPLWEGLAPNMDNPLLVSFRTYYRAARTKTGAYERARVHSWAALYAYETEIQPHQVQAYLEENRIGHLAEKAKRAPFAEAQPIAQRTSPILTQPNGGSVKPAGEDGSNPDDMPELAVGQPPAIKKILRAPKYETEVDDRFRLEVLISIDECNKALNSKEFVLHCRQARNGRSSWVRIEGTLGG